MVPRVTLRFGFIYGSCVSGALYSFLLVSCRINRQFWCEHEISRYLPFLRFGRFYSFLLVSRRINRQLWCEHEAQQYVHFVGHRQELLVFRAPSRHPLETPLWFLQQASSTPPTPLGNPCRVPPTGNQHPSDTSRKPLSDSSDSHPPRVSRK